MAITASLPGFNLFSNLPTTPPPPSGGPHHRSPQPQSPIPIPRYPPPLKSRRREQRSPEKSQKHPEVPAFKTHHLNSKYHKPVKPGQVIAEDGGRSVVVGESGVSYRLPGAPFEFQFSYSETPKAKPLAIREPAFLPFSPPTMPRPWTGKAPMKKSKRKIKLFEPLNAPEKSLGEGVKRLEMLRPYELGKFTVRPREEVLGEPLTKEEIRQMLRPSLSSNRQVNLGRDGLTHNMLELIHTHWRKEAVCKVRCLGVPTVDMNNICRCLEEKTGGKIIHRVGGVVYLFRGRNYDHRTRPRYPVMLWKPATPVYPKLIQDAPEGLTKEEADELRMKGKHLLPICKLAKNGVYITLVRDVRVAFEGCHLVKIDCRGMHASDYKKIGAKLKELVPCVLLSFDDEQILMWRGKDWKSMYRNNSPAIFEKSTTLSEKRSKFDKPDAETVTSSPKMMSLWQHAIESGKALLLKDVDLQPDDLLEKVEEFDNVSQAMEHSFPALVLPDSNGAKSLTNPNEVGIRDDELGEDDFDETEYEQYHINDTFETTESSIPYGALPVDSIIRQFSDDEG